MNSADNIRDREVTERLADSAGVLVAMRRGVQRALWTHKIMGVPICTWRDGRVVVIAPEDIAVEKPADFPTAVRD